MAAVILDKSLEKRLIARRRRLGIDIHDEVWEGVYVMAPAADIEHQDFSLDLAALLKSIVRSAGLGECFSNVNVSDRKEDWRRNFRCPDVAVFLIGNPAEDCQTFWYGGPDLAIEVVSPHDRTRKKIPFYEKVGTRELLIVDRNPWRLALLRLADGKLRVAGQSTAKQPIELRSDVVPVSFALAEGGEPARLVVRHSHDGRQWTVEARQR